MIITEKQNLVDLADLIRVKSGLTDEMSLEDMYAVVEEYMPTTKPYYLTFSAPDTFSISVSSPGWDGTIEYSTDTENWSEWNGEEISGTNLYIRGSGNTKIACQWILSGENIACAGNIETLLDYTLVSIGEHPPMAEKAYYKLFYNCTSLIQAPKLPAVELIDNCYSNMFDGCIKLTQAPELPATTLANYCYYYMFYGCTSLTQAPKLPATALANYCYAGMFANCPNLTQAPKLPATALANYCYAAMFSGCTNLTQAPELPATTLASECYKYMFIDCTGIKLSETQTNEYTQEYRIPISGTGTTATNALMGMFSNTGGSFTGTPSINTTYYLHKDCAIVGGAV